MFRKIRHCELSDPIMKEQIPCECDSIEVVDSENIEKELINSGAFLKKNYHIPSTKNCKLYKYKNPRTLRLLRVMKCNYPDCQMTFRKWQNFFDHLRIHTRERPYVCPFG